MGPGPLSVQGAAPLDSEPSLVEGIVHNLAPTDGMHASATAPVGPLGPADLVLPPLATGGGSAAAGMQLDRMVAAQPREDEFVAPDSPQPACETALQALASISDATASPDAFGLTSAAKVLYGYMQHLSPRAHVATPPLEASEAPASLPSGPDPGPLPAERSGSLRSELAPSASIAEQLAHVEDAAGRRSYRVDVHVVPGGQMIDLGSARTETSSAAQGGGLAVQIVGTHTSTPLTLLQAPTPAGEALLTFSADGVRDSVGRVQGTFTCQAAARVCDERGNARYQSSLTMVPTMDPICTSGLQVYA